MNTGIATESENAALLNSLAFPVLLTDDNQLVSFVNNKWLQYTGRSLEDELGQGWMTNVHPADRTATEHFANTAVMNGESLHLNLRLKSKDGQHSLFTAIRQARPDINQTLIGHTISFIRVADALSDSIRQTLEEQAAFVDELTAKLSQKNAEQERNNAELESFTYIASHDLQEPLRKIQSFSKMIMAKDGENLSGQGKDYFQRIMSAAERMQRLIDDLLSYSGTNVSDRSFESVDLNMVLQDVKATFQEVLEEKDVRISVEPLPKLSLIRFQINQLFTNILANALKFCKPDQPIVIDIRASAISAEDIRSMDEIAPGQYWQISFSDNGIGFEQQYEGRIFQLFQRLHGKNEYIGTGIGLAICKKIVHNHNGYLTATGVPGEGSVFNIYLPANKT